MPVQEIEINGEKVNVKKDFLGYRIVNPIKNNDGSVNWVNLVFGGWRNFLSLLGIMAIIGFLVWSHKRDITVIEKACNISKALSIQLYPGIG